VRFDATISDSSAERLSTILSEAKKADAKSVLLVINSGGGSVDAGMKIVRDMEDSPVPVYCVVDGEAASMAFYILQSCKVRIMLRRSRLMAHEPYASTGVSGNRFEFASYADYFRVLALSMAEHESHRLRISLEEFLKRTENKDWWMAWEDAVKVGAVDEVYWTVSDATAAVQQRVNPTEPLTP
jgi:ATP-dependent Clp protease protease subunit